LILSFVACSKYDCICALLGDKYVRDLDSDPANSDGEYEKDIHVLQIVQNLADITVSLKEQNIFRSRQMEILEAEHLLKQELMSLQIAHYKGLATKPGFTSTRINSGRSTNQ